MARKTYECKRHKFRGTIPCTLCNAELARLGVELAETVYKLWHPRLESLPDEQPLWEHAGGQLTVGDIRKAREILKVKEG